MHFSALWPRLSGFRASCISRIPKISVVTNAVHDFNHRVQPIAKFWPALRHQRQKRCFSPACLAVECIQRMVQSLPYMRVTKIFPPAESFASPLTLLLFSAKRSTSTLGLRVYIAVEPSFQSLTHQWPVSIKAALTNLSKCVASDTHNILAQSLMGHQFPEILLDASSTAQGGSRSFQIKKPMGREESSGSSWMTKRSNDSLKSGWNR